MFARNCLGQTGTEVISPTVRAGMSGSIRLIRHASEVRALRTSGTVCEDPDEQPTVSRRQCTRRSPEPARVCSTLLRQRHARLPRSSVQHWKDLRAGRRRGGRTLSGSRFSGTAWFGRKRCSRSRGRCSSGGAPSFRDRIVVLHVVCWLRLPLSYDSRYLRSCGTTRLPSL
jgi:hypothetical protein